MKSAIFGVVTLWKLANTTSQGTFFFLELIIKHLPAHQLTSCNHQWPGNGRVTFPSCGQGSSLKRGIDEVEKIGFSS